MHLCHTPPHCPSATSEAGFKTELLKIKHERNGVFERVGNELVINGSSVLCPNIGLGFGRTSSYFHIFETLWMIFRALFWGVLFPWDCSYS